MLSPYDLVEAMEAATMARDLPGMADVDTSLLCFCKQIRQHVKVALSGECADEILAVTPGTEILLCGTTMDSRGRRTPNTDSLFCPRGYVRA